MYALELSNRLARRGHRVVLSCPPGSRLESEAGALGITTLPLDVSRYLHPGAMSSLRSRISSVEAEIIHCHQSKDIATVVPAMLLSGRRCPIVLSKSMGSSIRKRDPLHRITYRHVSCILAISRAIRDNVIETTPAPPDRVRVLHFPVDTMRFSPSAAARERVREEFGIPQKTTVVGYAARFTPGKGHEDLLESAAILRRRHTDFRLLLVGEPSYGESLYGERIKRLANDLGLKDTVVFTGFRRDVPEVMAAMDIFAFPSHAEAFGMVLIEAMAMELPVVSTNCDGVLDIVVDGETGIYVPPHEPDRCAAALDRLMGDAALRRSMGIAGRKRAVALFDWPEHLRRLESIYTELLPSPLTTP